MKALAALLTAGSLAMGGCGEQSRPRNMTAEEVAAELGAMRVAPGLWELTSAVTDVAAPDLPHEVRERMIGPRSRLQHCITPAMAERPSANFLAARDDSACAYRDFTVRDGRIEGLMTCPDVRARMRGTYGPQAYDMRMEMESPMAGGAVMTLTVRSQGRRIGECEEGKQG